MNNSFWINCVPPKNTHQSALRIFKTSAGRQFVGRNRKGLKTDKLLQNLLLPYKPRVPYSTSVELSIRWVYPYRKSEPKKNRNKPIPCTTRPDADNILKGLIDSMCRVGFFSDDSIIFRIHFEKFFSSNSGIGVTIRTNTSIAD